MYATAIRGHDATWYTQQELVLNDRILSTARRYGPPKKGTDSGETLPPVPPPDPGEQAAALRMVCRLADTHNCTAMLADPRPCTDPRHNADAAIARETLLALGVLRPAVTMPVRVNGAPGAPTGVCAECGRTLHLRKDLTVIAHTRAKKAEPGTPHCPGSHTPPRSEAR